MQNNTTICAIATAQGVGAIAIVRLSGSGAIFIADKIFKPVNKNKNIIEAKTDTIHYGNIYDNNKLIDDVLVSIFKAPNSYTGEDSVEISCHGSVLIQQQILDLLIKNGASLAQPGEFTQRAFLNGKMDLSQAEAVADLIATNSKAAHKIAISQMKGGFSNELQNLRNELLSFISLVELELDFSEEDVVFADRQQLNDLIQRVTNHILSLKNSFELGNVIKNGIPVAIIGEPNVGKSTLLNALLNEDKAIVSDIPGTTRDTIEDVISIKGLLFRFIDTAGIRDTSNQIENLGIERTMQKIDQADIILYMVDSSDTDDSRRSLSLKLKELYPKYKDKKWILVFNKTDKTEQEKHPYFDNYKEIPQIDISAKYRKNISGLIDILLQLAGFDQIEETNVIISNIRHKEALDKAYQALERVNEGIELGITNDFLAQDIRQVLHYIGEITGEFTNDEILGNIFKNFCIGK